MKIKLIIVLIISILFINVKADTEVTFSNIDKVNESELVGTKLVVKDTDGNIITLPDSNQDKTNPWVTTDAPYKLMLREGEYTLVVEEASKGYILNTEPISFTVGSNKMTVVNENIPLTGVDISSYGSVGDSEFVGVTLEIRDNDNKLVESWVSSEIAHHATLEPGLYKLVETKVPKGYEINSEVITFTVLNDGTVLNKVYIRTNEVVADVPITASTRSFVVGAMSVILILIGSTTFVTTMNKVRKQNF